MYSGKVSRRAYSIGRLAPATHTPSISMAGRWSMAFVNSLLGKDADWGPPFDEREFWYEKAI